MDIFHASFVKRNAKYCVFLHFAFANRSKYFALIKIIELLAKVESISYSFKTNIVIYLLVTMFLHCYIFIGYNG